MIIKKITAPTIREAILQVKRELGDDAVILKTRKIVKPRFSILNSSKGSRGKRGLLDFMGREQVEITAATKDYDLSAHQPEQTRETRALQFSTPDLNPKLPQQETNLNSRPNPANYPLAQETRQRHAKVSEKVAEDLASVKNTLAYIAEKLQFQELASLPAPLAAVCRDLINRGVEERLVKKFAMECAHGTSNQELGEPASLKGKMSAMISNCIRESPMAKPQAGRRPRVIAVVGPTGTGKTTTLVKMATNEEILGRQKVAFVSADTYRIAAVEQLKTFAAIAAIPVGVVYSPEEMPETLGHFKDRDYVLIDTAGRSQNHLDQLLELRQFMQRAAPDEIHLVLSVTTKHRDLLDIIGKFDAVGADRFIFTKLDESASLGTIVNIAHEMPKPIAFVTFGQSVPGDIAIAKASHLAGMIMSGRPFLARS
jgi:flagellar biosynthesis protein FlhF